MRLSSLFFVLLIAPSGCSVLDGGMAAGGGGGSGGGAGGAGGGGSGAAESCAQAGATRACCGSGMQVCGGSSEFLTWGPCKDANGGELSCCMPSEFTTCDGGASSPLPSMPALCKGGGANNEPEILIGYAPANNQTVGADGQIKVWINDEGAAIIAPNELVDPNTGAITKPGDRTAKAPDGYLWEPALYIAPQSAENGGAPHFPTAIHGYYNNNASVKGAGTLVAGMDPVPAGSQPLTEKYTTEDVWDVSSLGLAPGTYIAEFVIHDGDRDRGVGCVTIVIAATQ